MIMAPRVVSGTCKEETKRVIVGDWRRPDTPYLPGTALNTANDVRYPLAQTVVKVLTV